MNSVHLSGVLSDKPIGRAAGKSYVCNCRIGIQNGTKEKPDWCNVNLVVWGNKAENLAKVAEKGDKLEIVGYLTQRSYDKNGTKVYVTEVKVIALNLTPKKRNDDEFVEE